MSMPMVAMDMVRPPDVAPVLMGTPPRVARAGRTIPLSLIDARSPEQWERTMITVLEERPARLPMAMACRVLGINRSTVYAWRKRRDEPSTEATTSRRHCPQPRALSAEERAQMLEIAHSGPYR